MKGIAIGVIFLLAMIGLSGCIQSDDSGNSGTVYQNVSIIGYWKSTSTNYYMRFYENGTYQTFVDWKNYVPSEYYKYEYNDTVLKAFETITKIYTIDWEDEDTMIQTLQVTNTSASYIRVDGLP